MTPPRAAPPPAPPTRERFFYLDALRVAVIMMVIVHHAAQPFGGGGDWPIKVDDGVEWLDAFFLVNAAFGLGLLFLLAGYFVPRSYDRKGAGHFLRTRWARIGVPLVIFALLMHVPIAYAFESPDSISAFIGYLYGEGLQPVYIHLWFLGHLLLYSLFYVAWRQFRDRRSAGTPGSRTTWAPPTHITVVGFVVALALVTWVVRWWYPIDEWVPLFYLVAAEPAHMPQYVSLFVLGILAYRGDWLNRISTRTGMIWLGVGVAAAAGIYAIVILFPEGWKDVLDLGGFTWQSLLYSTWEAVICAGLCIGLVVLFRQIVRRPTPLLLALAAASYAAYILHLSVVLGLQAGVIDLGIPPIVKLVIIAVFGVVITFGIAHLSRHVPGLRTLLGTKPSAPPSDATPEPTGRRP